jgi:hypothetical protein
MKKKQGVSNDPNLFDDKSKHLFHEAGKYNEANRSNLYGTTQGGKQRVSGNLFATVGQGPSAK